ncbi:hypothetical protein F7725_019981 [Dissostichus mawsoni]|uniref:Uncharacterized protein n=1 Tax=Dissostichus mawsoni TaxID=36200 RepID=A0A7J5YL88_DISMA|nr:hypothetical protein F7725_019981 [Dissostichus mawsoni]
MLHIYHGTGLLCRLYKSKKHGRPGTEKGVGEKFHVSLAGCTNGAHETYVNDLKGLGQIEVITPEQSDYLVLFCPIASRVGTDIGEAMDNISDVLFHESKMLICNRNDMAWFKRLNQEEMPHVGHTEVTRPEISDYLLVFCPIASRIKTDIDAALNNIPGSKPTILVVMHHTFNPHQVVISSRRAVNNAKVFLTVDCLFYEGNLLNCECNDIAWEEIKNALGVSRLQASYWNNWGRRHHMLIAIGLLILASFKIIELVKWHFETDKKNMDDQGQRKVPGKKFHVSVAGCTNGAHQTYVNDLKGLGQIEVISPEQSDYLVLFCPIASRVGTDIGEAMNKISDHFVPESRRLVENPDVIVTVDVLFHESKMLICNRNDMAWAKRSPENTYRRK